MNIQTGEAYKQTKEERRGRGRRHTKECFKNAEEKEKKIKSETKTTETERNRETDKERKSIDNVCITKATENKMSKRKKDIYLRIFGHPCIETDGYCRGIDG